LPIGLGQCFDTIVWVTARTCSPEETVTIYPRGAIPEQAEE